MPISFLMARRKNKVKTFDTVYLMLLMLSSIVFPVLLSREVDIMTGIVAWMVSSFLTLDYYFRTTSKNRIKRKKLKQKIADQQLLQDVKKYGKIVR